MTNKDWFDSYCQRFLMKNVVEGRYAYKTDAGDIIFVFYKGKTEDKDGATVTWPYNGTRYSTVINMDLLGKLNVNGFHLLVHHVKTANETANELKKQINITALTLQGNVWNALGEKDNRYE